MTALSWQKRRPPGPILIVVVKKLKNTKIAIDHFWKQQFEFAKDPRIWLSKAYDLKYAGDTLCKISKKAAKTEWNNIVKSTKDGTFKNGKRTLSKKEIKIRLDAELSRKCFLLRGFAFENMLKGILIQRHPEFIKTQGVDNQLITHDLNALADRCKIKMDKTERKILNRLTKDITWQQRYPIPLKLKRMISTEFGIGATNVIDAHFPNLAEMNKLFKKLQKFMP